MTTYDRAKTINSLAVAMGMQPVSKKDLAKYDTARGTIYCNDRPIDTGNIEGAILYFKTLKTKALKSLAPEAQTVAGYYTSAIDALEFLKQKTAEEVVK
ncbi:MAG: hypothetical protein J6O61_09450 [Butyrivibrio sp.]|uniref:hypothetical protein n=1 Tax=Butyrivibrio sp. TaxID=28121 RepID=UPI001B1328F7|nr:hypothetical protein [Butyrivibrio sp.]MBO6241034.1 hypothetical protein [Butyrivibrio sp.]